MERPSPLNTSIKSDYYWMQCVVLWPFGVSFGSPKGGFLWLCVGALLFAAAPVARAACAEQDMKNEQTDARALTRAELRADFQGFVSQEFPVGSDVGRLLSWLKRSGLSEPGITYSGKLSLSAMTESGKRELMAEDKRIRQRRPMQGSTFDFKTLCGQTIYKVAWRVDKCRRILEIDFDQERCRFDIP
jgi:hypothetical protein